MAKEKEQDKQQDTKPQEELTEWQKRNIKFLKKKEAEESEDMIPKTGFRTLQLFC